MTASVESHETKRTEEAIKVPELLKMPDGREIHLTGWHPHVEVGSLVSVTVEGIIHLPEESE